MRQKLAGIGIVIFFVLMLISPKAVFSGALEGLLLWFQIVLPTLFPFILVTNLLIRTNSTHYISNALGGVLCHIFKVSKNGSFAVIVGFLCGYPMGSKAAADLTASGYISEQEGGYLLSFCNNSSPIFIFNFIVWKTLGKEEYLLPSLLILLGTPILMSFIFRHFYLKGQKKFTDLKQEKPVKGNWTFNTVDMCMMDSIETITKIGGYILLFSVILSLILSSPFQVGVLRALLPSLEVTNGITLLGRNSLPFSIQYPSIIGITAFGGFCAAAQTQCMIQQTSLDINLYIIQKLATGGAASLLACAYLHFV